MTRHFIVSLLLGVGLTFSTNLYAACPTFEQPQHRSFLEYDKIRQAIREGCDPPNNWRPQEGRKVHTGQGAGDTIKGSLKAPYLVPEDDLEPDSPRRRLIIPIPPISIPGGNENDCGAFQDPALQVQCSVRGKEVPLTQASAQSHTFCGASIRIDSSATSTTQGAVAIAMLEPGNPLISMYALSGDNMVGIREQSPIPGFFCEVQGQDVVKIFITPKKQSFHLTNDTKTLPVNFDVIGDNESFTLLETPSQFINMQRTGTSSFVAPPPNPQELRGQLKPLRKDWKKVPIDPECRTANQLFTSLPADFGDILFETANTDPGNASEPSCQIQFTTAAFIGSAAAATVDELLNNDDECMDMELGYDTNYPNLMVPKGAPPATGRISGQNTFTASTVRGIDGEFTTDAKGGSYYTGTTLNISGAQVYLGFPVRHVNEQAFINGAIIDLPNDQQLTLTPPGRIRVSPSGAVQFVDGGEIRDAEGTVVSNVTPMQQLQFKTDTPISARANGSIQLKASTLLPTNAENAIQLPYNTRLDASCGR